LTLDVAIVGASSSGLYAAELLAHAGRRVAVFERDPDLTPARRTLIITPRLQRVLGYLPEEAMLHATRVMAVATSGAQCSIELKEPDLIVERNCLAQFLAKRATQAGAHIHYQHRLISLHPHREGVALHLRTESDHDTPMTARAVIGADGIFSTVAHAARLPHPPTVPIVQAEVELPPDWNPTMTQVWFDVQETRFFYWLIPESETHGVVGLVADDSAKTRALLSRFLEKHNLQPLAHQASRVAMYHPRLRPWTKIGTAPVLLIGDAVGQVKVTTVGGTVSGFWGAQAAVNTLLHGTSYARELRPLTYELQLHWFIRLLLERLDNAGYDSLVKHITHPVRQFLRHHNRDEMAGNIWQLLLLQPRFLPLSLHLLLHCMTRPSVRPSLYSPELQTEPFAE
jgi:flavin-dependent dehydrogenase